jgi:hypothetical protein
MLTQCILLALLNSIKEFILPCQGGTLLCAVISTSLCVLILVNLHVLEKRKTAWNLMAQACTDNFTLDKFYQCGAIIRHTLLSSSESTIVQWVI